MSYNLTAQFLGLVGGLPMYLGMKKSVNIVQHSGACLAVPILLVLLVCHLAIHQSLHPCYELACLYGDATLSRFILPGNRRPATAIAGYNLCGNAPLQALFVSTTMLSSSLPVKAML